MKLNKVIGAYLQDLGQQIAESTEPICPELLSELLPLLAKMEAKDTKSVTEKAADDILKNREKEEMTPEECLACELAQMLGIGDLTQPGEFAMKDKPTIKIKIKKVSSSDDLNKILKELKNGGIIDLNTMNDSLGEYFDLNSIQEIMNTPMFKQGGELFTEGDNETTHNETTLEDFVNEN